MPGELPLGFYTDRLVNLADWNADPSDREWRKFTAEIELLPPPSARARTEDQLADERARRKVTSTSRVHIILIVSLRFAFRLRFKLFTRLSVIKPRNFYCMAVTLRQLVRSFTMRCTMGHIRAEVRPAMNGLAVRSFFALLYALL